MERRRFIPLSLAKGTDLELEQRTMLSTTTTGLFGTPNTASTSASSLPQNLQQRLRRIDNLPFFMQNYEPNRTLPASITGPIQDDLRAIIAVGHSASPTVLDEFNRTIRNLNRHTSVSQQNAASIINAFNATLAGSGVGDPIRAKFTEDMRALAKLDSNGPNPTILTTNDFGLIAQLGQAVVQQFSPPGDPSLIATDKVDKSNTLTSSHLPTFVGNAPDGVLVRIVDTKTHVPLGLSFVTTTGRYSVKLSVPLADGSHSVKAQILDNGYGSILSHQFIFTIKTPHTASKAVPAGPRT